jgi:hypothetical protein
MPGWPGTRYALLLGEWRYAKSRGQLASIR